MSDTVHEAKNEAVIEVDVAVVGGGVAGVSAAIEAARRFEGGGDVPPVKPQPQRPTPPPPAAMATVRTAGETVHRPCTRGYANQTPADTMKFA